MVANLTPCPSVDELERLLAEDLSGRERDTVETHVEMCTPCQDALARLSGANMQLFASGSESNDGSGPEPNEGFLQRLRDMPPPTLAVDSSELPDRRSPKDQPHDTGRRASEVTRFPGGRVGRYEILEKIAAGGMGVVYKARHVELGKIVALKILPTTDMDEISLARFKNEMRAIGRLQHPHIVAAHDAGDADGVHYLAMDFVDGVDLARLVRRHGRLAIADACEIIRQAALGLQHAFERGLVHRDIKPSNLMLTRGGLVQLLDLGLARATNDAPAERLTSAGALLGTADYLAPEQWEHPHAADTRADIYGLGCTLYHLLAGRPPFTGNRYSSAMAKMRAHHEEPPPPIASARSDIPAGLVAVLDRMLAKSPADRFATPAEVAEALRPFATGADLVRLLDKPGAPALAAEADATPGPAKLDTSVGSSRSRPTPSRRQFVLVAAGLAVVFIAAWLLWNKGSSRSTPESKPLTMTEMRIAHYRGAGRESLGDLRTNTASVVRVNDGVAIAAEFNKPAYYYLIALNPAGSKDGIEQYCDPDDAPDQRAAPTVPKQGSTVRYPRDDGLFSLDVPGLQVFVLAASSNPLPAYDDWRSLADPIPWTGSEDAGELRWQFDGSEFVRVPRERGNVIGAPKSLLQLRKWFLGRPEFETVQIFAFPVTDDRKQ